MATTGAFGGERGTAMVNEETGEIYTLNDAYVYVSPSMELAMKNRRYWRWYRQRPDVISQHQKAQRIADLEVQSWRNKYTSCENLGCTKVREITKVCPNCGHVASDESLDRARNKLPLGYERCSCGAAKGGGRPCVVCEQ